MVQKMDLTKLLVASVLLVLSGQSQALFMPEEFTISTDTTVTTEEGCGAIVSTERDAAEH